MTATTEPNWTTPDLCDAHPERISVAQPLFRRYGGRAAFSGQIVTVRCCDDNSRVKEQLAIPGAGKVLIVDGGGSLRRALLGDVIAISAVEQQWAGVIIHGCVRDVPLLAGLDLGVLALASIPVKTERRGLGDLNVVVDFAGVQWRPDDWVYTDATGVVVSPMPLA